MMVLGEAEWEGKSEVRIAHQVTGQALYFVCAGSVNVESAE
jgi:hypothetical protein